MEPSPEEPVESLLREVVRRTEARAFVHEDPASYCAGVRAAIEAIRQMLGAAPDLAAQLPRSGAARLFGLIDRGEALRVIEAF